MDVEKLLKIYLKLEEYTPNPYYEKYEVYDENSIINILEEFNLENVSSILLLILNNSKENSYILVDYIIHRYKLTKNELLNVLLNVLNNIYYIDSNNLFNDLKLIFNRFDYIDVYTEYLIKLVNLRNLFLSKYMFIDSIIYFSLINLLVKNVKIPNYDDYVSSIYVYFDNFEYFYNYQDNIIEYSNELIYPYVEKIINKFNNYEDISRDSIDIIGNYDEYLTYKKYIQVSINSENINENNSFNLMIKYEKYIEDEDIDNNYEKEECKQVKNYQEYFNILSNERYLEAGDFINENNFFLEFSIPNEIKNDFNKKGEVIDQYYNYIYVYKNFIYIPDVEIKTEYILK